MIESHELDPHRNRGADACGDALGGPTYLDLLEHARFLQQSAFEHDVTSLHVRLGELRDALAVRLSAGDDSLDTMPDAVAAVVRAGQRRLTDQIDDLIGLSSVEHPECRCIEGTSRVTSMLRRQARLESGLRS